MATSLGHYLFGLSLAEVLTRAQGERARTHWLAAMACVPDLDLIPGLLVGDMSRFHHGASHSLGAAALVAAAAFLALKRLCHPSSGRLTALLFILYASHGVLDALTLDTSEPRGVPLFWPWSATSYESPWLLLPNVQHTRQPLISAHNVLLVIQEMMLFLPLLGFLRTLRRSPRGWLTGKAWLYGGWFLAAGVISVVSLN